MSTPFAADPALPGRDVLLDPRRMPEILGRLMGRGGPVVVDAYSQDRAKYRIGDSLRLLHRFTVDGEPVTVSSRTYATGAPVPHEQIERYRDVTVGPLKGVVYDPELATVFWTFPIDRKLAHLPELAEPGAALVALVGGGARVEVVQYAPEKSATAACRRPGEAEPFAYVKAYPDDATGDLGALIHAALPKVTARSCEVLAAPAMLGYDRDRRFLALAAAGGVRLDLIPADERAEPLRRFGQAAAELHALDPIPGTPPFARLDLDKLATAARLIGMARPDVGDAAATLAGDLADRHRPTAGSPRCLHGDLHLKNAFIGVDRVTLIDLDLVGWGDPAAEIGSFLAALRYPAIAGRMDRELADRLEEAFLEGYASVGALPPAASLNWHVAAALLAERALRAVNRVRRDGLDQIAPLIDEAQAALGAVAS